MILDFAKKSLVYAGSVLIFSAARQLCFFPAISSLSADIFSSLFFQIFLLEAILYGTGASTADYYVKTYRSTEYSVLPRLSIFSLSGFIFLPFFIFVFTDLICAFLASFYLASASLVQLLHKPLFNHLKFYQNYKYTAFKLLPYGVTLFFVSANIELSPIKIFLFTATICEIVYIVTLLPRLPVDVRLQFAKGFNANTRNFSKTLKSVSAFTLAYLLMGVIQRGDLLISEVRYGEYFNEFAQFFAVCGLFCNPVGMLFSASLISFINNKEISHKNSLLFILAPASIISIALGALAVTIFPIFTGLLYLNVTEYSGLHIFGYVSSTIIFLIIRPLTIMYSPVVGIIKTNVLLVLLNLTLAITLDLSVIEFATTYSALRFFTYLILIVVSRKSSIEHTT